MKRTQPDQFVRVAAAPKLDVLPDDPRNIRGLLHVIGIDHATSFFHGAIHSAFGSVPSLERFALRSATLDSVLSGG